MVNVARSHYCLDAVVEIHRPHHLAYEIESVFTLKKCVRRKRKCLAFTNVRRTLSKEQMVRICQTDFSVP